ncbi:hypothetical protein M3223_01295 [Paenibacillus pasadenensis]|uniref:hypothetical protein n=1 Tax=Paenibacillus pasadenensis TaxID=217090 RepID=UPI00203DE268|nr:hypothetical protein [Paenibacillus pasadenensis]MCM3745981.1 hypothetical protein [Paenibacillus pasadenensis]
MKRPDRSFWTGLGIGIIVGALLLQLLLTGQQVPALQTAEDDGEALVYTVEEAEVLAQAAVSRALAEQQKSGDKAVMQKEGTESAKQSVKPSASPDKTDNKPVGSVKPSATPKSSPKPSTPPSATAKPLKEQVVRIVPGSNLTDAAALLLQYGLIESEEGFIRYMEKQKPAATIRAGYFKFIGQPDLAAIKDVITGQPMDPEEGKRWLEQHSG